MRYVHQSPVLPSIAVVTGITREHKMLSARSQRTFMFIARVSCNLVIARIKAFLLATVTMDVYVPNVQLFSTMDDLYVEIAS